MLDNIVLLSHPKAPQGMQIIQSRAPQNTQNAQIGRAEMVSRHTRTTGPYYSQDLAMLGLIYHENMYSIQAL